MDAFDRHFDQLRALVQQDTLSGEDRKDLFALITQLFGLSDDRAYDELWPYLESFPHHFATPIITLQSAESLKALARTTPECVKTTFIQQRRPSLAWMGKSTRGAERIQIFKMHDKRGVKDMEWLARGRHMDSLEELDLVLMHPEREALVALCSGTGLGSTRRLKFWYAHLDEAIVELFLEAPFTQSIDTLDMRDNALDEHALSRISSSHLPHQLTHLSMRDDDIGAHGARTLFSSGFEHLEHLELWGCNMGDEGIEVLAKATQVDTLHSLTLGSNAISDKGAMMIAEATHLRGMAHLNLAGNAIGDEGASTLFDSPVMADVSELYLSANNLGDASIDALIASPHVTHIRRLGLSNNAISLQAFEHLHDSTLGRSLHQIIPANNRGMSDRDREALRRMWGTRYIG